MLARDRLLGSYEVKPKLALLKRTLLGTGGALAVCSVLLVGLLQAGADAGAIVGAFAYSLAVCSEGPSCVAQWALLCES